MERSGNISNKCEKSRIAGTKLDLSGQIIFYDIIAPVGAR